jgi:hypothetical protein
MFAMRPALYHRESCLTAEKSPTSTAPNDIAAQIPVRAAMLLRSWMSDHD